MKRRQLWIWLAAAAIFAGIFLVHSRFTNIILFPPVEPITKTPDAYGLPWSNDVFPVRLPQNVVTVHGWEVRTKNNKAPWIILLHGRGRNRSAVLKYAPMLYNAGYNLFLFDFPGHGESDFSPVTLGAFEKEAVKAAAHHITARGIEKIAVMGISMGGSAGILAAAEDARIDAIIADSAYSSFVEITADRGWAEYRIPKFPLVYTVSAFAGLMYRFNPFAVDIAGAVQEVSPRPLLIIHSASDEYIPVRHARAIQAKALGPGAQFWIFESAEHDAVFDVEPEEYKKRILDFLSKNFPVTP